VKSHHGSAVARALTSQWEKNAVLFEIPGVLAFISYKPGMNRHCYQSRPHNVVLPTQGIMRNPHSGHFAEGQQELHSRCRQPPSPSPSGSMQYSISLSDSQLDREHTIQLHLKQLSM
jgi:hypothetical protein